ncbi:MAG TPA: hypothetical protein VLH38_03280 [Patescibacteria group bacterium]|nr:hypothetical protein [Patescibacteria group bacterium]
MLVKKLMERIHRKYAGDTKYPQPGSGTYDLYLGHANDFKHDWATDPDNRWKSLLEPTERSLGTATGSKNYALDDSIIDVSDWVYIDTLSGQRRRYSVVKAKDRSLSARSVYLTGQDPKSLNFTDDMPDEVIGGTIRALCFIEPDDMKSPGGTVPVDRPGWVALSVAGELARNDPAKDDQFPDINGQANDEWDKMVSANNSLPANQVDDVPIDGFYQGGDC